MSRLKVSRVGEGLHPREVVVRVRTADGADEEVAVDETALAGDTLEIGYPIALDDDRALVELPRETSRGSWRLWVPRAAVVEGGGRRR